MRSIQLRKTEAPCDGKQRLAQVIQVDAAIDPASLLAKATHFFRYAGSLTTPPCSTVVGWNVFAAPVAVAQSDIGLRQGLRSRQAFELPSM
ncbi:MAG TPA: carbonic anhydrase family protein [Roseiarcus sp.]|jgi:carbonic anhydrase|nr:carbonic anhydrase family protein [Roseiarcus sp.]